MRSPAVVHVSPAQFGENGLFGGGERYPLELARAMADLVPTRLVTFGARRARCRLGNLEVVVLVNRIPHRSGMNPVSELLPLVLGGAQVIHAHQYETATTNLCLLYGRATGRRVFVTDLGVQARDLSGPLRLHRLVTELLAISQYSVAALPELADRAYVVHGGVDTAFFFPDPSVPRRDEVVFVGRLLPHKGVHLLIEAIPEGVPLRLFGRPYDTQYLEHLRTLAHGKDVTFDLEASDVVIRQAYRRARVAVLPSLPGPKSELLGLAPLEAMACGTPAICSRTASLPEVVEDGVTGLLVEPDDGPALRRGIARILGDTAKWPTLSAAAIQHVQERFTWDRTAHACLGRYGDL